MVNVALKDLSYLVVEANSSCNLACTTCNREELAKAGLRKAKNLSESEFVTILDQCAGAPIDTIKFQGLSEPMLHPRFDRLAEILRHRFPQAVVIIATNLQYQLEKTPFLATLPFVDVVYLSIDGVGANYERARTGAKYARLLQTLSAVRERVAGEVRRQKLQINMTVSVENYRDIPQVYALREEFGLGRVNLNLAQNWNEDERLSAFDPEMLEYLKEYKNDVKGVPNWEFRDCFWPHSGTVIDVEGNVRQCLLNTSQEPFGNVFQQPLSEIFGQSEALQRVRRQLLANAPGSTCENCSYKELAKPLAQVLGDSPTVNKPRVWRKPEVVDGP